MDWDDKPRWVDKQMAYTAASMELIRNDLKSILDRLDDVMGKKKDGAPIG